MNNIKDNLLNTDTWLRLLLISVFFLARCILIWVINLFVAAQFLLVLFTGEKNQNLDKASIIMGSYLIQIVDYQTFASDTLPWPWSDFPDDSRAPETDNTFDDDLD